MKKFCSKTRRFRGGFSLLEVLFTVLILAVYLLVVDWVWSILLHYLHVLRFSDTTGLGSQAG